MKPKIKLCDGCNVNQPWEHRCHGEGCSCEEIGCKYHQGRISYDEVMKIVKEEQP